MQDSTVAADVELAGTGHDLSSLPSRVFEIIREWSRHLYRWYAFCVYVVGLGAVACLAVPNLVTDVPVVHTDQCRAVTKRVVEAAATVRRLDPSASLEMRSDGMIAGLLGGKIPTCPDGGHVQLLPTGASVVTSDGVRTIVTSEYLAGVCVRENGDRCHADAVLVRIQPLDVRLDRLVRPDTKAPVIEVEPAKPATPNDKKKKKKAKKRVLIEEAANGITVFR